MTCVETSPVKWWSEEASQKETQELNEIKYLSFINRYILLNLQIDNLWLKN